MTRFTAMFYLTTFDGEGREKDRRIFIGTLDEAVDELKAEYEHHFPQTWDTYGRGTDRSPGFWKRKRLDLQYNGGRYSATVTGQDRIMGIVLMLRMEKVGPYREEQD
jgi:hypothetical protein